LGYLGLFVILDTILLMESRSGYNGCVVRIIIIKHTIRPI